MEFKTLPLDIIRKGKNVRSNIDIAQLKELAAAIEAVGLINPITVFEYSTGEYEIIAGYRRYMAHSMLKRTEIECKIIRNAEIVPTIMLQENLQRENIDIIDEANGIARAIRKQGKLQKDIARDLGKSESWVADRMAILRYPAELLRAMKTGKISFSVAREFAKIKSKESLNKYLEYAIENGCNPKLARKWVKDDTRFEDLQNSNEDLPLDRRTERTADTIKTGCHICGDTIELTQARHINCCPSCFNAILKDRPQ